MAQTPVAPSQVLAVQVPSAAVSQVTTVVASTTQALLVQISVPLQRSPSSEAVQSAVVMQAQVLVPAEQVPA